MYAYGLEDMSLTFILLSRGGGEGVEAGGRPEQDRLLVKVKVSGEEWLGNRVIEHA